MQIAEITLFQVPWTQAYDNLPFGTASLGDEVLMTFLKSHYTSVKENISGTRSFKTINGSGVLSIERRADTVYSDYNYAVIKPTFTASKYFYYFINQTDSLNDSRSPSCELQLTYDSFMNNRCLFESTVVQSQLCSRSHVYDLKKTDSGWVPNYKYSLPSIPVYEEGQTAYNNISDFAVCWARITALVGEQYTPSGAKVASRGCYPEQRTTFIACYPLYFLHLPTLTIREGYWRTEKDYAVKVSSLINNNLEEIISIDATFYPPFKYNMVLRDDGYPEVRTVLYDYETETWRSECRTTIVCNQAKKPYLVSVDENGNESNSVLVTGIVYTPQYTYTITTPEVTMKRVYGIADNPNAHRFPVTYQALFYNNAVQPLLFTADSSVITYKIDPSTITPRLYIESGGWRSKPIPLENSGALPTSSSVYDSYVRANGNKILAQREAIVSRNELAKGSLILGAVSGVARAATTGSVSGLINTVGSTAKGVLSASTEYEIGMNSIEASMNDLRNRQDQYSIPSVNISDNILQDLVLKRWFAPTNDKDVDALLTDITYYGFATNTYRDVREATHECYDFVKTINAHFPWITNLRDRYTLERAFNNGVTLWHFDHYLARDPSYNDDDYSYWFSILLMDKNTSNLQKEQTA